MPQSWARSVLFAPRWGWISKRMIHFRVVSSRKMMMMVVQKKWKHFRNKKWRSRSYSTNRTVWQIEVPQKLFCCILVPAKVNSIVNLCKSWSSLPLGENNEMLQRTLQLGISLLHGGNREVQKVNISSLVDLSTVLFSSACWIIWKRRKTWDVSHRWPLWWLIAPC